MPSAQVASIHERLGHAHTEVADLFTLARVTATPAVRLVAVEVHALLSAAAVVTVEAALGRALSRGVAGGEAMRYRAGQADIGRGTGMGWIVETNTANVACFEPARAAEIEIRCIDQERAAKAGEQQCGDTAGSEGTFQNRCSSETAA